MIRLYWPPVCFLRPQRRGVPGPSKWQSRRPVSWARWRTHWTSISSRPNAWATSLAVNGRPTVRRWGKMAAEGMSSITPPRRSHVFRAWRSRFCSCLRSCVFFDSLFRRRLSLWLCSRWRQPGSSSSLMGPPRFGLENRRAPIQAIEARGGLISCGLQNCAVVNSSRID